MESAEKFPWIPFYMNFADALLPYRNDRQKLLAKLRKVFSSLDKTIGNLNLGEFPEDIDPFTIYVEFNNDRSEARRLALIRSLKNEFAISVDIPNSFLDLPLLYSSPFIYYDNRSRWYNHNTIYYDRAVRNEQNRESDIESLWEIFSSALALTAQDTPQNRETFSAAFDRAHPQKDRWYLTTGLFWIRPYRFLELKRYRGLLKRHKGELPFLERYAPNIFKKFPRGRTYLTLCDAFRELFSSGSAPWSSFPELTETALPSYSSREPVEMVKPRPTPTPLPVPSSAPEGTQVMKDDSYTREDFLNEVFLEAQEYDDLVQALKHKKNLILQGPPGVGKTFVAKRLASALAGRKDTSRVKLIQFHQNTSYEDFIMGFRPGENGFELKPGTFYTFCKEAEKEKVTPYFLIIDEINRGNTSKIFGDMFMLLENDKRGTGNEVQLLYKDEKFSIPDNLYIIGTMNTADRSLAMLDYALRRRFAFYDLKPAFDEGSKFSKDAEALESKKLNALLKAIRELNDKIAHDPALGEGFRIGHSYFIDKKNNRVSADHLDTIVNYELIPLIREYCYDDPDKAEKWSEPLSAALQ